MRCVYNMLLFRCNIPVKPPFTIFDTNTYTHTKLAKSSLNWNARQTLPNIFFWAEKKNSRFGCVEVYKRCTIHNVNTKISWEAFSANLSQLNMLVILFFCCCSCCCCCSCSIHTFLCFMSFNVSQLFDFDMLQYGKRDCTSVDLARKYDTLSTLSTAVRTSALNWQYNPIGLSIAEYRFFSRFLSH